MITTPSSSQQNQSLGKHQLHASPPAYPKVFVIVLNWNGLRHTLECLDSIFRLEYPNFHVVVVDNASDQSPALVLRTKYSERVTILQNPTNLGYTGGNNQGIRYALANGAAYVWLLNNDTVVEPDSLHQVVLTAERTPGVGLVSPIINYYHDRRRIQFAGRYVDWDNFLIVNAQPGFATGLNSVRDLCLIGTALLIKRKVLEDVGYLCDDFFAYWEDIDFSVRSLRHGYHNRVEPSAKVYHKNPPIGLDAPGRLPHYYYYMVRNSYIFWTAHVHGVRRLKFLRRYLSDAIEIAARCRQSQEEMAACLDGMWSALVGIRGQWNTQVHIPRTLKAVISLHPYLWAALLRPRLVRRLVRQLRQLYKPGPAPSLRADTTSPDDQ